MIRPLLLLFLLVLWLPCGWAQARLEIRVEPDNKELRENIQAYIGSLEEYDQQGLQRFRATAQRLARQAGEALGYYRNRYQVQVLPGDKPVLQLLVELQPPVTLRTVDIRIQGEAAALPAFKALSKTNLEPGAQLHHGAYESLKTALQQQALRYGFFQSRLTRNSIEVSPEAGVADVYLYFDSGPRYAFGAVEFHARDWIEPQLLQKLVPFARGDAYDSVVLAQLSQNLNATGYFEQVRVDAPSESQDGLQIPVQVSLQPVKPRTYGVGAGYSTDQGARARFDWEHHRINRRGHKLGFDAQWADVEHSASGWYAIPLAAPLTDQLRFVAGYQDEDYVDAHSRRYTYGVQWHKRVGSDWQRVLGMRYDQEDYDYGSAQSTRGSRFLMPSIGFGKLRADSRLDPSQGYRLQLDISGAKEGMVADADVLHVSALARGLTTLADNHRLLLRAQVGAISTNNYSRIPPSLRFFAGGDQSLRGYDYQKISPRDAEGNRVGGRYMLTHSLEYQYSFSKRWRVASFVDQGNAMDSWSDSLKTSVGMGVRWISPIGPLRLDLAHALDDDRGWRIHFSMGPEL